MADTLVSARISKAKKDAAAKLLASMGSTASDLINDAFDYVLSEKRLPTESAETTKAFDADFTDFVQRSTIKVDWGAYTGEGTYKDLIEQGKAHDYESLA